MSKTPKKGKPQSVSRLAATAAPSEAVSDLVNEARAKVLDDLLSTLGGSGPQAYADAIATYLAFAVGKAVDRNSSLCSWEPGMDRMRSTFGRQALPMVWDYTETNPFADAAGDIFSAVDTVAKVLVRLPTDSPLACVPQTDVLAGFDGLPTAVFSTDPPYYDNIGHADLSDYFYVWLRRSLGRVYPSAFATLLTPKTQELIASPYRHDGSKVQAQAFLESGLGKAFSRMRDAHIDGIPLTIYYAFKQAESEDDDEVENGRKSSTGRTTASTGWETMLTGLVQAGFSITGTWPMRTEASGRMVSPKTSVIY